VKNQAYLSLGSNVDKERNLPRAVELLAAAGRLLAVSRVYETAPVGRGDQPNFFNAAVLLETDLELEAFKNRVISRIEDELGRVRDPQDKNAPRTIDIDISLWNDEVREVGGMTIPDPQILRFAHIAVPLADIAPDHLHPLSGETLATMAGRLAATDQVVILRPDIKLKAAIGG